MVRDINAGRFSANTSLVLLTHGLSLRIFLMRWFHWTVDEFLNVFNPPNCQPLVRSLPLLLHACPTRSPTSPSMPHPTLLHTLATLPRASLPPPCALLPLRRWPPEVQVLERVCEKDMAEGGFSWIHTKSLYRLTEESCALLKGVTPAMCSTSEQPNGISASPLRGYHSP